MSGKENFKRSIPIFSSSISVFFNDKVIASSIYDPLRNDFYFTEEGKGAFLNDHRIRVSNRKYLENSLISLQINNSSFEIEKLFLNDHIPFKNFRILNSSIVSMSWLCNGKLDCFIGTNMDKNFILSSKLLLRESGGFFLEASLNNYPNMVLDYSQLGNVKLGNFSQLDIRFDKKWNKENVSINFFLEILNLLAQKIPTPTEYGLERDNYGNILTPYNLIEVDVNRESIIPSFGFSIDF